MAVPASILHESTPVQVIAEIQATLGVTLDELAQGLSVDPRTMSRWAKGSVVPQQESRRRLDVVLDLARNVAAFFATLDDGRGWLRDPNRYLGGISPLEAIRAGRVDRARAALGVMQWGIGI